ncbi:hypothetical protein FF1_014390 [Malus domestica]|uniref:uncharacterized protein At2g39795, mitochondrial n=1 Tax=Malus sylvestris TaxID=3752 RepID=UPI0021AC395F|nr:uncharacterized protein At2g39795, mitochondrial [Malus sylvestris]
MSKAMRLARQGCKALKQCNLLRALQSEIQYELSSNPFQERGSSSLGDFVVEWDSPRSQDVVLRRKFESGEEVAVSALLGPFYSEEDSVEKYSEYPGEALMKVCVKKPGLSSMLQFDCSVFEIIGSRSVFNIHNAHILQPSAGLGPSVYRGPAFSSLDDQLQDALKEYLQSKGIGESLTNFLLHHLHKKEHGQYVNWLHILESHVAKPKPESDRIQ